MEITVKMSPEEYDSFRAYQKDKESLEREVKRDHNKLRQTHEELCSAVLDALEQDDDGKIIGIKDDDKIEIAFDLANDWFC